jgi:multidrug efflux pump subunit AcrB
MTAITITTNVVGAPDADDRRAMMFVIAKDNERIARINATITQENARRAALNPPEQALPLLPVLPSSTGAERKSSYESVLNATILRAHESYVTQAAAAVEQDPAFKDIRPLWADATPAKKAAAIAALS